MKSKMGNNTYEFNTGLIACSICTPLSHYLNLMNFLYGDWLWLAGEETDKHEEIETASKSPQFADIKLVRLATVEQFPKKTIKKVSIIYIQRLKVFTCYIS